MSIRHGSTVVVHYVGTLADGTEFDRSTPESPLEFQVGQGQMIPGFEQAVLGHEKGDSFTVTIAADQAYGLHNEELIFPVPLAQVPEHISPQQGMMLHVATDQGELEVVIAAVEDDHILLDANHPLAGQDLTFALTIVDER